jgi:hypothetical protein
MIVASAWMFHVALFALMCGLAISSAWSAMSLEDLNRLLGKAVRKALIDFDMPIKEAVAIMGIDRSQFIKALRGEGYRLLALNHLIKLGPVFMVYLTRHLMSLTAEQRYLEIIELMAVRKQA